MARDFISRWRRLARPIADALHTWRCRRSWRRGEAAGQWTYVASDPPSQADPPRHDVLLCCPQPAANGQGLDAWARRQTLSDVVVQAPDSPTPDTFAFFAPGPTLPRLDPSHLEAASLILAAEDIDAVVLWTDAEPQHYERFLKAGEDGDELSPQARRVAVYRSSAYAHDAATDRVVPRQPRRLVKWLPPDDGSAERFDGRSNGGARQRGPYRSAIDLPGLLRIAIRSPRVRRLTTRPGQRSTLLVVAPFLARGGAEQTLFATLEHLRQRFDFIFVTLAPHRPELGDRRQDFRQLSPRLLSLGDWVHPAAMPGMLAQIIATSGARLLYNANGTTLFYEFAPRLKARFPDLRILDHLYDHRVGYIDRYDRSLLAAVDCCVAENHPIQEELVNRGWPRHRAPVIWPCGRPADAFPSDVEATRRRLRRQLELKDDAVVVLAAMRMHSQKRPLDLVELARRCADLQDLCLLMVGGGDLETAVDAAIAEVPDAPIRRLPFRPDIPDLICAADLGCLVSDYEGLPVFLLECLQMGRPFLGTDVGELGRVLRDSGAGCVVDQPGDLDALETALRRLMDPDLRQQLAARARAAAPHFSVAACAERYALAFIGKPLPSLEGLLTDGLPPSTEDGPTDRRDLATAAEPPR